MFKISDCDCRNWAREGVFPVTKHHPRCVEYDPEGDAVEIINALLDGLKIWANDEDGVHPDCWEPFVNAAYFVGRSVDV